MMMLQLADAQQQLEANLPAERARLVRLCALLSGDAGAAEDLAQEALFEAWRHADGLRDPERRSQWLSGIARNVCLRWRRRRGREAARRAGPVGGEDDAEYAPEPATGQFDVEVELERQEMAALLDRALALLPATTRLVLIERYVRESPQAEVAARLGLSEGAVAMRLQRGKLALRRVLAADLNEELTDSVHEEGGWQETTMWCPLCGRDKLRGHFSVSALRMLLRCPTCTGERMNFSECAWTGPFHGARTFKLALDREMAWVHDYISQAMDRGHAVCDKCGQPMILRIGTPQEANIEMEVDDGICIRCTNCCASGWASSRGLTRITPEGRRFWREHGRITALPEREIEAGGQLAVVNGFQTLDGRKKLEAVRARDSMRLLAIYQS